MAAPLYVASAALGFAASQPVVKQWLADLDFALGVNESSRARFNLYRDNRASTQFPRGATATPIALNFEQLITLFNQNAWAKFDDDPATQQIIWDQFRSDLRNNAIYVPADALPGPESPAQVAGEFQGLQWRRLIDMSAAAAPLGSVVRDFYRSAVAGAGDAGVDFDELSFNLQRAQLRRKQDRDRILQPYYSWSLADAQRLLWMGVIDANTFYSICKAAGLVRGVDADYLFAIAPQRPDAGTLSQWAVRSLWDNGIAQRYGLDDAYDNSPIARFWAGADGVRPGEDMPGNAPEGSGDWDRLQFRAGVPLPNFREALELQHRLRPSDADPLRSVVAGVPSWTWENTQDMLRAAGYPQPIIDRMAGLQEEPLNVRILNEVLLGILKHPNVAADATRAFGPGVDFVASVFADHGFSPDICRLAADALRARASDEYHAELIESQKALRRSNRELTLKEYAAGKIDLPQAQELMAEEFFGPHMVAEAINQVDREIQLGVTSAVVESVKNAYLEGKINLLQVGGQLTAAGISANRQIAYTQEWVWQRGDRVRMLSTGEILSALKSGLMTPSDAMIRLTNLGWTEPDATIEIAMAEREIAAAASRSAAIAESKSAAQQQREIREAMQDANTMSAAKAKAEKEAEHEQHLEQLARPEQAKALEQYIKTAMASNDAYNSAAAKGDTDKMQEEIARAAAAYYAGQIEQIKLRQESSHVAAEVGPIDEAEIPVPQQSQGASGAASPPAPPGGGAGEAGAGNPTA